MRNISKVLTGICGGILGFAMSGASAIATALPASPTLHGFCWGATPACTDNGTNTPTATNPPNFGFAASGGPSTGDFLVDILIPNNLDPSLFSFGITGIHGGADNTSTLSGTASLFSTTAWTSGFLDAYLGITASPANPIGAFLPSTQAGDPSATGFFVYQLDLGTNQLWDIPDETKGPELSLGSDLPEWSYIVGFLDVAGTRPGWGATANSGAILMDSPPTSVPEPESLTILGAGLLALSLFRRKTARAKTAAR